MYKPISNLRLVDILVLRSPQDTFQRSTPRSSDCELSVNQTVPVMECFINVCRDNTINKLFVFNVVYMIRSSFPGMAQIRVALHSIKMFRVSSIVM